MNVNQRIKSLRKELKLNQRDFGAKIGLVQTGVSWMEKDGNTVIPQNVKIICDTFNVSEDWLTSGTGDMFRPAEEPPILERLQDELKLNAQELDIIRTFISLPSEQRRAGVEFIRNFATSFLGVTATTQATAQPSPSATIDERVAAYRQELEAMERFKKEENTQSSAQ